MSRFELTLFLLVDLCLQGLVSLLLVISGSSAQELIAYAAWAVVWAAVWIGFRFTLSALVRRWRS